MEEAGNERTRQRESEGKRISDGKKGRKKREKLTYTFRVNGRAQSFTPILQTLMR